MTFLNVIRPDRDEMIFMVIILADTFIGVQLMEWIFT